MDAGKISVALQRVRMAILSFSTALEPVQADTKKKAVVNKTAALQHSLWMYERAVEFLARGDIEKAKCWLCFMQSTLWIYGLASIDDWRETNRPVPASR